MARAIVGIFLSLLFVQSSFGQDVPPKRDSQALAVLSKCASVMGSGQIPDVYAQGSVTYADTRAPQESLTVESKGADRQKSEFRGDTTKTFVIGTEGGHYVAGAKRDELAPWVQAYFRPEHLPAALCSIDLNRPSQMVENIGIEATGAKSVYHIKFSAQPQGKNKTQDRFNALISEFHVYIDAESFVVLKTRTFAFSPDSVTNRSDWELIYSDYRDVNGTLMPFRIDHFLSGNLFETMQFNQISTTTAISDAEFSN